MILPVILYVISYIVSLPQNSKFPKANPIPILQRAAAKLQQRVINMAKDYTLQGTTRLQREKFANEALALSTLDAPAPSEETMALMREHIDGKLEITEVLALTIEHYKRDTAHA